jgi:hypothetical protein
MCGRPAHRCVGEQPCPPFRRCRAVSAQDRETATPASLSRRARHLSAPNWSGRFLVNVPSFAREPRSTKSVSAAARLEGPGRSYLERLDEAISTDLNTAQALAVLTRVSRDDEIGRDALGVLGAAFEAVLAFGLLDLEPKDIEPPARKLLLAPDEIDQLLGEREDARRRGDFAVADEIRDMLERLGIEVRDTPEGAVLIAIRPSRKHRPPTSDSAAPPGLDRRASHEDQIVNLGLMATDFPQYRLSFDRPE